MHGTLIFDGNCGFCTRCRDLLGRLDRKARVRTLPFQQPGVAEEAGATREELGRSVCWLGADGARYWGAEAANAALSAALGNRLPLRLYRVPGVRQLQNAVYRWVADHRHRLPGTTPWCSAHPATCD